MMGHLQVHSKVENKRISVDCSQSPNYFSVRSSYLFPIPNFPDSFSQFPFVEIDLSALLAAIVVSNVLNLAWR